MKKILIILLLLFTFNCQHDDTPLTQNGQVVQDNELILKQKQALAGKEINEKFQRELNIVVERQIQQQHKDKIKNDLEIIEAKRKIANIQNEATLKDLKADKQIRENELRVQQERYGDLQRQLQENNERLKKHQDELKALQKQSEEIDKSGAEQLRKIRESVK